MQAETVLQNRIRLAVAEQCRHARLFRNHCGQLKDPKTGQWVRFGLGPGSPDLVGWRVINGVAQFVGLEVKVPGGRLRDDQVVWLDAIEQAGGLASAVTSVEQACAILDTSLLTP
jgi:hypothetical protein